MEKFENLGAILARLRSKTDISQSEMAQFLSDRGLTVTNQAVSKWEKGATIPNAVQFLSLCDILGVEDVMATFTDGRYGVLRDLNELGRQRALEYIDVLAESKKYSLIPEPVPLYTQVKRVLPLYTIPVSAGTGQFLDSDDYEMVEVGEEVPEGVHFGVRVSGNSMEPKFHDGDYAWVKQQRTLNHGEIGIFLYDGCAYLKQMRTINNRPVLHSLNPNYSDILISSSLPLRVLGKVIV